MDTSAPQIGIAIKQCTDFMREVYREISSLFGDLDDVLKDAHWGSAWYSNLFLRTNSLSVDQLLLRFPQVMGRVYVQQPASGFSRHAAVIEIHLSPSCSNEALLMLAVIDLGQEQASGLVVESYRNSNYFIGTLLKADDYTPGAARALPPQEHRGVFTDASSLHIVAWPLTEMTSRDALNQTVVAQLSLLTTGIPSEMGGSTK